MQRKSCGEGISRFGRVFCRHLPGQVLMRSSRNTCLTMLRWMAGIGSGTAIITYTCSGSRKISADPHPTLRGLFPGTTLDLAQAGLPMFMVAMVFYLA